MIKISAKDLFAKFFHGQESAKVMTTIYQDKVRFKDILHPEGLAVIMRQDLLYLGMDDLNLENTSKFGKVADYRKGWG